MNNIQQNGHLYWLDIIRFLAAFAVMACHFRGAFFVEYSLLPVEQQNPINFSFYFITRLGYEAVLIFFVLSGFLVGGKAIKRLSTDTFKAKDYAIDRFARIMLPLVSSLLLYLPICLYFNIPIKISDWVGSILSLQCIITDCAFETLWSLSYEVWFYILIFAFAILWTNKNKGRKLTVGIGLLTISLLVFAKLNVPYLFVWLVSAIIFARFSVSQSRKYRLIALILFLFSFGLIVCLQLSSGSHYLSFPDIMNIRLFRSILTILFGVVFAIFLCIIIQIRPTRSWVIKLNNWGTKMAAFSYTLYLTHVPVLRLLEHLGAPKSESLNFISISLYVCWLLLGLGVAYGLYYIFERNTPKFKAFLKSLFTSSKG